jgi:spiro-SPASM protein
MRALTVLFAASLAPQAFQTLAEGKSPFALALERALAFPGAEKVILLAGEGEPLPPLPGSVSVVQRPRWNVSELLKVISESAAGYDFAYYGWADSPFLDPSLAEKTALRHVRFAADYSYADGWPYGLGPELVTGAAAGILYKIAGDSGFGPVKRDSLFGVLQKDINSFDIETEISPVDLRYHRLSLSADSKRNFLLLQRFAQAFPAASGEGGPAASKEGAGAVEKIIAEHPEYLRTLPAFFPVQVSAPCPGLSSKEGTGACALCPYPRLGKTGEKDFLDPEDFIRLLDKIENFAGDGVIDLSLWGELSLHPRREELIRAVLERPALSLVVETSGLLWGKNAEELARLGEGAPPRLNGLPPLSWIISLNPGDLSPSGGEAAAFAKSLVSAFPREKGKEDRVYVQAVRTSGAEDEVEQFYRSWKAYGADHDGPGIIIQKYDDFCGFLPRRQGVDLSPVERRPCWHLMRDLPVLIDGTVPVCRENVEGKMESWGNLFTDELEIIWKRGEGLYSSHCGKDYGPEGSPCRVCDEYYTFNF